MEAASGSAAKFRLVGIANQVKGCIWCVDGRPITVGRGRACDIHLMEPSISRVHCEITARNGSIRCVNRSATGVTLVNGKPVDEAVLKPGDELAVGTCAFVLAKPSSREVSDEAANEASTASPDVLLAAEHSAFAFPNEVRDVVLLFKVCRDTAACETLEQVLETLVRCIRQRFTPKRLWLARHEMLENRFRTPTALQANVDDFAEAPIEDIKRLHAADKTACFPVGPQRPDTSLLVCPFSLSERRSYVLAFASKPLSAKACEDASVFCAVLTDLLSSIAVAVEARASSRRALEIIARGHGAQEVFKGRTKAAGDVRRLLAKAASTDLPVLILGETGVGKEIVARAIHDNSARASGPYVVCNCPAIPSALFESELFGHVKGAFTGADSERRGLFEQANGSTIFLDEVGDLGLEQQAKILRVLETGVIRRVGGSEDIAVNLRIIAAANGGLVDAVAAGQFREDLFHRLCGFEISIPPLRSRREDIPVLAEHFLMERAVVTGGPVRSLSEEAVQVLASHHWPGNVRELRQVIGRSYALADTDILRGDDIILGARATAAHHPNTVTKSLAAVEREHIAAVLELVGGRKSKAADLLGIGRDTLRRKVRVYGLPC